LEGRITPNTVNWTGLGGDFNWGAGANWSNGVGPGSGDDAVISSSFAGITVTHNAGDTDTVHSLTSQAALSISAGSLSFLATSAVNAPFSISNNGTVQVLGGNFTTAGPFTNQGSLTVGTGSTFAVIPPPVTPPANPVSWWKGEGNANDSAGVNNGTLHGGVAFAPGEVGQAFSFDGSSGYVDLGNNASLNLPGSLTVSVWVNARSLTQAKYLFADFDPNGYVSQGSLGIAPTGTGNHFFWDQFYTDGTPANPIGYGTTSINLNQWYHVAVVRDDSAKTVQLFVNGALDLSASYAGHTVVGLQRHKILGGAGAEFTGDFFNGLIDEAMLYNRALTASEVQSLFNSGFSNFSGTTLTGGTYDILGTLQFPNANIGTNAATIILDGPASQIVDQTGHNALANFATNAAGGDFTVQNGRDLATPGPFSNQGNLTVGTGSTFAITPAGLVSSWKGEGNANDSARGNNGTIHGGVTFVPGEAGQAFSFDGSSGYVDLGNDASLNLPGSLTFSAWVNVQSLTQAKYLFADFDPNGYISDGSLELMPTGNGNHFAWYQFHTDGSSLNPVGTTPINLNQWYYVAVVRDDSSKTVQIYVNGSLDLWASYAGHTVVGLQRHKILGGAGAEFTGDFFNGLIDEAMLYNRALTASELQGVMNPAMPGAVNIQGSSLTGSGTVNGNLVNAGIVSPGVAGPSPSAATLTINGDYTQTLAGALNIKLGGTTAGSFDQLNVSGLATLDGALNVSRINGFSPAVGNSFTILPFGSRSGDFATKNGLNLGGRLILTPTYNANDLTLVTSQTSIPISPFSWTPVGPAPIVGDGSGSAEHFTGRLSALAVDPTNSNVVYAGAASGGVWKTTNFLSPGGATWVPLTDNQVTLNIGAIALAPSDPNVIYAGTGEGNFVGLFGRGILKSTDGGATWALLGQAQFGQRTIAAIVVHPTNPNLVYAAIAEGPGGNGILRSTDGGQTWTTVLLPGASMTGLVMDPTNPETLYAAAGWVNGNSYNGVYRTTDGGDTWSFAGNFPHNVTDNHVGRVSLAISRTSPSTLYAVIADPSNSQNVYKVMKTTNGNTANPAGINWQSVGDFSTFGDQLLHYQGWYGNVITVDPFDPNVVYAAGYKAWETRDGGGHWTKISTDSPLHVHDDQHALAFVNPGDPAGHRLLMGTDGGLYRLDDPNPTRPGWANLNTNMQVTQFYQIALDPVTPDIAFGASQDNGVERFEGGLAWAGVLCCDGYTVAVSPTNHNRVYANWNGVFLRSDDGGNGWQGRATPAGSRNDLFVVDPNNGNRLLMGGNAVYESTSGGDSWTALTGAGWPSGVSPFPIFPRGPLAVSTSNSGKTIYFMASVNGSPATLVTFDGGATNGGHWQQFNSPGGFADFADLKIDPRTDRVAYAVSHDHGIFRTTNGGQSWSNISGNLPNVSKDRIALDPKGPGTDAVLYVATAVGVYASSNGGASWSRFNVGLPNASVSEVEIQRYAGSTSGVLAAGTYGRGMWETVVGVSAQLQGGTLTVLGDANDNVITVRRGPTDPSLLEVWEGTPSGGPFTILVGSFSITAVDQIVVRTAGGNDTVTLDVPGADSPVPGGIRIETGTGNSTVNVWATGTGTVITGTGAGHDRVNVGNGSVAPVLGDLFVGHPAAGGLTTLTVDDSADPTGRAVAVGDSALSGLSPAAVIHYTAGELDGLVVRGGTGGNTFSVSGTTSLAVSLDGGAGNNTLVGPDSANAWDITGTDAGTLDGAVAFTSFQNLTGGSGPDTFRFGDGQGVSGTIDGGGGTNALDYSAYTSNVLVNLQTGSATGAGGGIANVQNVTGGAGSNLLVGNGGNVLTGGSGRNLLIAGAGASTLLGGNGEDILIGGTTSWDTNPAALAAVMAEWTRADLSYADRVDHLLNGGGLSDPYLLNASTVTGNRAGNVLTGGPGLDLFFGDPTLDTTDWNAGLGEVFVSV
jgi:hypothetical protein